MTKKQLHLVIVTADFPTPESYTAFRETIKASDGVLFVYLRKQPHRARLPEKRSGHRLQTQCRRRLEKHARRHHQPFRRQNGRLQLAEKPASGTVLLRHAADRTTRSLPRQLPHPV